MKTVKAGDKTLVVPDGGATGGGGATGEPSSRPRASRPRIQASVGTSKEHASAVPRANRPKIKSTGFQRKGPVAVAKPEPPKPEPPKPVDK